MVQRNKNQREYKKYHPSDFNQLKITSETSFGLSYLQMFLMFILAFNHFDGNVFFLI